MSFVSSSRSEAAELSSRSGELKGLSSRSTEGGVPKTIELEGDAIELEGDAIELEGGATEVSPDRTKTNKLRLFQFQVQLSSVPKHSGSRLGSTPKNSLVKGVDSSVLIGGVTGRGTSDSTKEESEDKTNTFDQIRSTNGFGSRYW